MRPRRSTGRESRAKMAALARTGAWTHIAHGVCIRPIFFNHIQWKCTMYSRNEPNTNCGMTGAEACTLQGHRGADLRTLADGAWALGPSKPWPGGVVQP